VNARHQVSLAIIVGIRSQYMKLASLQAGVRTWNIAKHPHVELISINSGQHYSSSLAAQYLREYSLAIDIDLTATHNKHNPDEMFSSMYVHIANCLRTLSRIDAVVVFGDANTTLAGALAARRLNLPLVHVESGLRTGTWSHEEINRVVTDRISDLRLVSSRTHQKNLISENLDYNSYYVGDLVQDLVTPIAIEPEPPSRSYVLASIHRQENLRDGGLIERIFNACVREHLPVMFLAHPKVLGAAQAAAERIGALITVVESLPHRELLRAVRHSKFLITDSGGLQREAYYLRRRAIVIQDVPLWQGLVQAGFHTASATDSSSLRAGLMWAIANQHRPLPPYVDFGEVPVAQRTIDAIVGWITDPSTPISRNTPDIYNQATLD